MHKALTAQEKKKSPTIVLINPKKVQTGQLVQIYKVTKH